MGDLDFHAKSYDSSKKRLFNRYCMLKFWMKKIKLRRIYKNLKSNTWMIAENQQISKQTDAW